MNDRDFDIIDVRAGIEAENGRFAALVRELTEDEGVFLINLMASPGAGKTSVLCRVIDALAGRRRIGVMEADMDADVDARTAASHGAEVGQLHTGASCHMDAKMTLEGLAAFKRPLPEVIILENVGNLVCPAEFDVGADMKYDPVAMEEDIATYGLYGYDDFKDYVTYEQYVGLNLRYLKISVGKGYITFDELIDALMTYVSP